MDVDRPASTSDVLVAAADLVIPEGKDETSLVSVPLPEDVARRLLAMMPDYDVTPDQYLSGLIPPPIPSSHVPRYGSTSESGHISAALNFPTRAPTPSTIRLANIVNSSPHRPRVIFQGDGGNLLDMAYGRLDKHLSSACIDPVIVANWRSSRLTAVRDSNYIMARDEDTSTAFHLAYYGPRLTNFLHTQSNFKHPDVAESCGRMMYQKAPRNRSGTADLALVESVPGGQDILRQVGEDKPKLHQRRAKELYLKAESSRVKNRMERGLIIELEKDEVTGKEEFRCLNQDVATSESHVYIQHWEQMYSTDCRYGLIRGHAHFTPMYLESPTVVRVGAPITDGSAENISLAQYIVALALPPLANEAISRKEKAVLSRKELLDRGVHFNPPAPSADQFPGPAPPGDADDSAAGGSSVGQQPQTHQTHSVAHPIELQSDHEDKGDDDEDSNGEGLYSPEHAGTRLDVAKSRLGSVGKVQIKADTIDVENDTRWTDRNSGTLSAFFTSVFFRIEPRQYKGEGGSASAVECDRSDDDVDKSAWQQVADVAHHTLGAPPSPVSSDEQPSPPRPVKIATRKRPAPLSQTNTRPFKAAHNLPPTPDSPNFSTELSFQEYIASGETGHAIRCYSELSNEVVVIKLSEDMGALRKEALVYEHIRRSGMEGIVAPPCYGLFQSRSSNLAMLLVADAGRGLDSTYSDLKLVDQRQEIIALYEKLHSIGIVHNDLALEHLCLRYGENHLRLIDFGRAILEADIHDKQTEMTIVRNALGPRKIRF